MREINPRVSIAFRLNAQLKAIENLQNKAERP